MLVFLGQRGPVLLGFERKWTCNREAGAALGSMLKTCTSLTALDVSENAYTLVYGKYGICDGPGFASEIASGLKDAKGSLSSVNLLKNGIGVDQANALVKIKESKPNLKTLCGFTLEETELDMSNQGLKPEDAVLLASDIPDMGALSKLTWSGDRYYDGGYKDAPPVTLDTTMTEVDLSNKHLGASGAKVLAAVLGSKSFQDKGSLSNLKLNKYELPVQEIKTATALDLSGKGLRVEDAIVIAALIKVQANFKITLD